jgi:hypothetical protein
VLSKNILFCLLLVIPISGALSQKLVFQNLGVKQGLPATEVYNLFQDKDGYVWVFTEYGIVKHNGSKFIPVCKNLPFKESAIYALAVSRSGELFVANSQARVYQIHQDKAFLVKGLEKHTREIRKLKLPVLNLFLDNQDRLSFTTFQKTYTIPKVLYHVQKTEKTKRFAPLTKIHPLIAFRGGDYPHGKMYVSIQDRFGSVKQLIRRDSIYMSRIVCSEFNGNSYVSFLNEIQLYRKNALVKSYRFDNGIINFKIAPNGHVWVAFTNGGLQELDKDLNLLEHYLGNTTVSDVLFDDQSGMWVSTIGQGIFYCRNRDNHSYNDVQGLNGQISMLNTINRKLVIGTISGKLFIREQKKLREIHLNENTTPINDIIEFDGLYFVGTKALTYILDRNFKIIKIIPNNSYTFCKTSAGGLMIITGSAISEYEKHSKSFKVIKQNKWNRELVERFRGEFFVVIQHGIYRLKKTVSSPDYLIALRDKNVSRIKTDSKKNIWICTKGNGLYKLTPANRLEHYVHLPSQIINDVHFLSDEIALLSTNKGAFVKRLNELRNPSPWKQLLDEEVTRVFPFEDEVFIGASSGLSSINIRKLFRPTNYRLHLASVELDHQKIPFKKLQHLNYKQNDLYFNFNFLAYEEWSQQLNYDLKGPSNLKGQVEGTQIHLQNLSPGKYTLLVYPKVNLAHKNNLVVVTTFYIEPAFWQTIVFRVLMIVIGIVLTILCSWLIMRSRRKKEMKRIQLEKLLAEYRLTALKAQVNPHFMSNSLVAIQELIIRQETSKANQYLAKFSALLRNLLNYSDQSVISLYNELKIIDLYIDLEQLRFSNRFAFIKEVDDNIQLDQLFIPALITQPLIENAIWHGLLPLPEESSPILMLSIEMDKNRLCISIKDNGVGRIPKDRKVLKPKAFKESKGMKLIEKRMENLNKLYAPAEGSIEFIDLTDEAGRPTGSTVRIFFSFDMLNKLYDERNQERNY